MFNVFVATDFHLWDKSNDSRHPFVSVSKLGRLSANYAKDIQVGDMFIYLGDLCDPDVTDMNKLKAVIQSIPGYKVLTRGNHDTMDETFYLNIGFDAVCDVCKVGNLIFSHMPVRVAPDMINIHGDNHNNKQSNLGRQHINAYDEHALERPFLVEDLLEKRIGMHAPEEPYYADPKDLSMGIFITQDARSHHITYSNILDLTDKVTLYEDDQEDTMNEAVAAKSGIFAAMDLSDLQTPQDLYDWMRKNIHYAPYVRLKTDVQVIKTKSGSCHDQVYFAYPKLRTMGVSPQILFFIAYNSETNTNGMTHSLIYWKDDENGGVTWFENSWGGQQGIKEYKSLDDLKEYIETEYAKMPAAKKNPELYFRHTSINRFKPGMTLAELVNKIMEGSNVNESIDMSEVSPEPPRVEIYCNKEIPNQDWVERKLYEIFDAIEVGIDGVSFVTASQQQINLMGPNMIFGERSVVDETAYIVDPDELSPRIEYDQVILAVATYVAIRDKYPDFPADNAKGIAYFMAGDLVDQMLACPAGSHPDIYCTEARSFNFSHYFRWAQRVKVAFGRRIFSSILSGAVTPAQLGLVEAADRSEDDPINEILFDDIADTEYWLNDDSYEKKYRKKEPLAEAIKNWKNDKGEEVPKICTKCGAPIKVFLRGEPVFLCSDKKCGKYYGTVPCNINEVSTKSTFDANHKNNGHKSLSSFTRKVCDEGEFGHWYNKFPKELKRVRSGFDSITTIWMTKDESELVAYINIEKKGDDFCIQALEVLPEYRNYGLSDQLMKYAKNNGATMLFVDPENKVAINLYKKHGWEFGKDKNRGKLQPMYLHENVTITDSMTLDLSDKIPNADNIRKRVNLFRAIIESPIQYMKVETISTAEFRSKYENQHIFGTYDSDEDKVYLIFPDEVPHEINYEDLAVHEISHSVLYYRNPNLDEETEEGICIGFADYHYEQLVKLGERLNDPDYYQEYTNAVSFIREKREVYGNAIFTMLATGDIAITETAASKSLKVEVSNTTNPNDSVSKKAVHLKFYDDKIYIGEVFISAVDTKEGFVYNLEVSKNHRGKGYGRQIMQYVMSHYDVTDLTVDTDNEIAINLYKSLGWKTKKKFKDSDNEYRYWMKYTSSKRHLDEAAADLQGIDRKQQEDISKKYGIRAVGHDVEDDTPEKRVDQKREKQIKNLKRARKIKKRKAFVRKVKSKLPSKKNEEVDISDIPTNSGEKNFFDSNVATFDFQNETGYKFKLAENIKFMDTITESADDDKLYPVYIMLMHSGTALATAIKTVTGSHFSHSSISFDSSMKSMYSFGRKFDTNPFIGSFKKEDIHSDFFNGKTIPYALYVVPCTKSEVDLMKKRLDYFIQNRTKFSYDFTGLFKNYLGIADNPEYKWFCSRFVADILNAGRPSSDPYVVEPSLMKPEDFLYTNFATYVTGGILDSYDKSYVDKVTQKILRVEKLRRQKEKRLAIPEATDILDLDAFDPLQEAVLNYQFTTMDEAAFDNFYQYLKSFKIRFDKDGNVIITRREYDQLDKHFRQSLRMIKAYEKADDLESVKLELCKIYYMIELINQHYLNPTIKQNKNVKGNIRKEMMDLRSVMLNVFQQHLKYVTVRDPQFNFQAFYNKSQYSSTVEIPNTVISAVGKALLTKLK